MFNPFKVNAKQCTKFTPRIAIQPDLPTSNSITFTAVEDASDELKRLIQNEQFLLNEKQRLVRIIEELQHMLCVEMETKQRAVSQLKDEIPELQNKCEKIANALKIPVIK